MTYTPPKLRIVFAASEVVGFAKTGGLADVAGSLPAALARRGHKCTVIMPLYRSAKSAKIPIEPTAHQLNVPVGAEKVRGTLWRSRLPDSDVPVYLVEQDAYFDRDDPALGRGLYQYALPSGERRDYPDNCARFAFFCRAVMQAITLLDLRPDIIHGNDWQTGLLPVYLREDYRLQPGFEQAKSFFTIHNIAYQGAFWHWDMRLTGLDWRLFNHRQLEFYGQINFLKGGIVFADLISTVSPTYAKEIQTAAFGCGLEGVLAERSEHLFGVVNGVDYGVWNPATDRHLPANYTPDTVLAGKAACKKALQEHFGLPIAPRAPLLAVIARLVAQKGVDLIPRAAEALFHQGVQLVVLGEGEQQFHVLLEELRRNHPRQVALQFSFDEALAHLIEAGCDMFLMPSLFEPSGLNQLYSLKYGSVPVVRATGGLADSIVDFNPSTRAAGQATGFTFTTYSAESLRRAVLRAVELYTKDPPAWLELMRTGMKQDWSWDRVAGEYERLYSIICT